jgi:hypothetical protein
MKQKLKKISSTILICSAIILSSCENDSPSTNDQTIAQESKITDAKNWFENYKLEQNLDPILKDVNYHWNKATITSLSDGSTTIIIPLTNIDVNKKDKGEKYLYLQLLGKNYNIAVYKFTPKTSKNTGKLVEQAIELKEVIIQGSGGGKPYSVTITRFDMGTSGGAGATGTGNSYGGGSSGSSSTSIQPADVSEAFAFLNSIKNSSPTAFDIQFIQKDKKEVLVKTSFYLTGITGIDVLIVENVGRPYTIKDVETTTWGFTLGNTWEQELYTEHTVKNITTVTIIGTFTYGTGIQGIGTIFSSTLTYEIKINNQTGKILSGTKL